MRVLLLGSGRSPHRADRTVLREKFDTHGCEVIVMEDLPDLPGESTDDKFERINDQPFDLICFIIHPDSKPSGFHYEAGVLRTKLGAKDYLRRIVFLLHEELDQDAILSQYLKDHVAMVRVSLFNDREDLVRAFGNELSNFALGALE